MKNFIRVLVILIAIIGIVILVNKLITPNIDKLERSQNIDGLIKALDYEKKSIKSDAKEALIRIGSPAVEPLLSALDNSSVMDRGLIIEVLGEIGGEKTFESLVSLLNDDSNEEIAYKIVKQLPNFGEQAIPYLIDSVKSRSEVTYDAEKGLSKIGKPALEPVIELLYDPEDSIKASGIRILEEIDDPRSIQALLDFAFNEKSFYESLELVNAAEAAVISLNNKDATILLKYLEDESSCKKVYSSLIPYSSDPEVNEALIRALDNYGNESMAESFLNSKNEELQDAAKEWAYHHGYFINEYEFYVPVQ